MSLVVSTILTYVMGSRYLASGAIFPAGVVAFMSAAMSAFYIKGLLSSMSTTQNKKEK